ncbi:hypothetical protein [Bacillus sp. B15-48]|uniref:hypothetical protein n=1 Tax=Bacillus sp. B15-48 TaxID=1548601 RepID=UPI00193FD111|nr:hypothetical protein [Bacillus sp. B15-48]MBM4765458.1 hypothetical protein [Bacillus sp. B15-48]
MKLVQIADSGYTHEFEVESDKTITIHVSGERRSALRKLKNAFPGVEIVTFDEMED